MKKFLSILLVGAMLLSFAACSASTNDNDDDVDKKNKSDSVQDDGIVGDSVNVGEYITFGSYEQDNDTSNGKEAIEWLVLDKQGDKALVVSKYALDSKRFQDDLLYVTWSGSSIRLWMKNEFLNEAFTSDEQSKIVKTVLNPNEQTEVGYDNSDKVFLLSVEEAQKYFKSDEERICQPTQYAIEQGCQASLNKSYEGNCWWWLRSTGNISARYAATVYIDGRVNADGNVVDRENMAVRPAMWIEL